MTLQLQRQQGAKFILKVRATRYSIVLTVITKVLVERISEPAIDELGPTYVRVRFW